MLKMEQLLDPHKLDKILRVLDDAKMTWTDIPQSLMECIVETGNIDALKTFCTTGIVSIGEVYEGVAVRSKYVGWTRGMMDYEED